MRKSKVISFLALLLVISLSTLSHASFVDIEGNWARDSIVNLEEMGALGGFTTEQFLPNEPMSREAVMEVAAHVYDLSEERQEELNALLDSLAAPNEAVEESSDETANVVTRSQLAGLVGNLLGIEDANVLPSDWYPSFADLDKENPAFLYAEILNKLGVLPTYVLNRFEPNRAATRAEVAHLLDAALQLKAIEGEITEILASDDQSDNQIVVQTGDDDFQSLPIDDNVVVNRGNNIINNGELQVGDQVYALYDADGNLRFVSLPNEDTNALFADSSQAIVQGLNSAVEILADVLTPEQVAAIVTGDWQTLNDEVRYELYGQLVDLGVAPWEAEALLSQDWGSVQDMLRDRVAIEAADYLEIAPEIIYSAFNRDWQRVMEYAQVELAERLLSSSWLNSLTKSE